MKWTFIDSDCNTGKYNMDFDIYLSHKCQPDEAFFRLYRWTPYAISIGANQSFDDIDLIKAKKHNIDIVKRPTGGRAILHSEELTYSLILPIQYGLTAREVYERTSIALSKALGNFDERLKFSELESVQPNFRDLLSIPSSALCFASTAKSEVKYLGKKIIGSAQRKMANSILQHGSILCGKFHSNLPNYMSDKSDVNELLLEIESKTIEISTITGIPVNYSELSKFIISTFESEWQINFNHDSSDVLSEFEHNRLQLLEA